MLPTCYRNLMIIGFIVTLLLIQFSVDIVAILGGYYEFPLNTYWLSDANGFVPFFGNISALFNHQVEQHRDTLLNSILFGATWTFTALCNVIYFRKRRFVASKWPLSLVKLSWWVLMMRLVHVGWYMYKFHFTIMREISNEFDEDVVLEENGAKITLTILKEMYTNGLIGAIPAILTGSLLLNLAILALILKLTLNTMQWRKLNVSKHYVY